MNTAHQATIAHLYDALGKLDGEAMQACRAADARFTDEVFSLQGRREIGGMWRMLCAATRDKGRAHWHIDTRDVTEHSAHWDAHYLFSATGRLVTNRIDAEFDFDAQGLIAQHRDHFDFWAWSRQALGPSGWLLGWSPFLRRSVQSRAKAKLLRFLERP